MTTLGAASPGARARLATDIADAVRAVPGVVALTEGTGVRAVTHYAGGTITGVVLSPGRVEVHITVDRRPVPPVAEAVHIAARDVLARDADGPVAAAVVLVCVDDVELGEPARTPGPADLPEPSPPQTRVRVAQGAT